MTRTLIPPLRRPALLGLSLLALALASLSFAATAPADTYCVNIAGCTPANTYNDDLQGAFTASSMNPTLFDTLLIGPVTLDDGPYTASNGVDIIGSGVGQTVLTKPSGVGHTVLALTGQGNATVSNLSIRITAATGATVPEGLAIYGGIYGRGVASDLEITAPGPLNTGSIGAYVPLGGTIRRSTISVPTTDASTALAISGGALAEDLTLTGAVGLGASKGGTPGPAATNVARYLRVTAVRAVSSGEAPLTLDSSVIHASSTFAPAQALYSVAFGDPTSIDATNLTVIGDGTGTGIEVDGFSAPTPDHADASVTLRNSVMLGFATPISRTGQHTMNLGFNPGLGNVTIDHSLYDQTVPPVQSGPGTLTTTDNLGAVDPRFASFTDFHLLDDSPLIDAGAAVSLPATDLDGAPGSLDGNGDGSALPDIGAFEHPTVVLRPDKTAPRLTKVSLSRKRFRVGRKPTPVSSGRPKRPRVRAGTVIRFTLSEPARLTIAFQRAVAGRRHGKRCVRVTRSNRRGKRCTRWVRAAPALRRANLAAGARNIGFTGRVGKKRLVVGRYRAVLVAVDAAGNRSAARTLGFRVVR